MSEHVPTLLRILVPRPVTERQPLLLLLIMAALGIGVAATVGGSAWMWLIATTLLTFAAGTIWVIAPQRTAVASTLMVLAFGPLFALWYRLDQRRYASAAILHHAETDPRPAVIEGVIDRPAVIKEHPFAQRRVARGESPWQTQFELAAQRIRSGLDWAPTSGRVVITAGGQRDQLRPGDAVRVYGQLERFRPPSNPGEEDFRNIYRLVNLHARLTADSVQDIIPLNRSAWRPGRLVGAVAAHGRQRLLQHAGPELGPLAIAMVIGQRESVAPETRDRLLVTGTVHLLSVSGLHLAMIVALAHWTATCCQFPPWARVVWVLAACLLYTALTGARPPVMRAAVLVAVCWIALVIKRPSQPINTLALAGLILLAWNPALLFGVGVQLSFLAVATLLLCHQRPAGLRLAGEWSNPQEAALEKLIAGARTWPIGYARQLLSWLHQLIWFSACVTAISAPLVWHHFHVISPISVLANVLLGPLLFAALAAGVLTVVLGSIDWFGELFGTICAAALWGMNELIESAAAVPWGHVWLPAPPAWLVVLFYGCLALSLYLPRGRRAAAIRYVGIAAWLTVAAWLATRPGPLPPRTMEATFIDVGHGTAVVLRSADQVWLYDCGRLGNERGRSRDIDATLWSLGVTRLDGVFLSHADADHFNGLPGLLARLSVTKIVTPPGLLRVPEPAVTELARVLRDYRVPVVEVAAGEHLMIGTHRVDVLHPPAAGVIGSDNANSLVLLIEAGDRSLLLPGDLEPPGTSLLVNQPRPAPGGVLMAPHHGSLQTAAAEVVQWARPAETVVSGSRRADRPEVHELLSATGSGVYVTSTDGAVRVRLGVDGELNVRKYLQHPW